MGFKEKVLEVQGLLEQVNSVLEQQKTALNDVSAAIEKYSKSAKIPSDFHNAQKAIKDQEKVRAELQKTLDANNTAVAKKKAQMAAMYADAEAKRKKDLAAQEAKTAKEIALYEKSAKAEIDANNKRIQSAEKRAAKEAEIEERKASRIIAANERLAAKQASIDARNSRTGASSVIPGMGAKISDLKETERAALANQKLSRTYNQLNADWLKAKNALLDLIASNRASNKEIRVAQKEFDRLDKQVQKANSAVRDFSEQGASLSNFSRGVGQLMGAFGISTGLYLAVDVFKDIYKTTKELQSLDLALKMVSGSQLEFQTNQMFIADISQKWGLEIKALTFQYTMFYTASKDLLSTKDIKDTFEGIAKAGSIMGLSLEKQSAAFYAIDQMMSKGTVTAEELKKQLGNAMPGAIKAAAMAYMDLHPKIKTIQEAEKELYAAMKKGALDSASYVPLIVANLNKLYGTDQIEKIDTLMAAQNRLSNSWTNLISRSTKGSSIFGKVVKDFMDGLSWWLDNAEKVIKYTGLLGFAISEIYETINADEIAQEEKKNRRERIIKQAIDDAAQLSAAEKKLTLQLSVKNDELERLQSVLLTAKGSDTSQIQNRIDKAKEEISVIEAKLKQEEMLYDPKRTARLNEVMELSKELNSESNAIILKNIELNEKKKGLEELNASKTNLAGNYDRSRSIDEITKSISKNNVQLTKNNDLMIYYRTLVDELRKVDPKTAPPAKETEAQRKERLKREKEFLDAAEKLRKDRYAREISDLQRQKELIKDARDIEKESLENKIFLENAYAFKEIQIAKRVRDEEVMLAKGSADLIAIAENNYLTEKENAISESQARIKALTDKFNKEQIEKTEQWYMENPPMFTESKEQSEAREKLESELKRMKDLLQEFFQETEQGFFSEAGFEKTYDMFGKLDEKGKTTFENLIKAAKKADEEARAAGERTYKQFGVVFQGITESAQEAFNFMSEASNRNFETEYDNLERRRDVALDFAGQSESAREEIERQFEARRREIRKREWKAQQQMALFNIAIDTAQAVVASVAKSPLTFGLPFSAFALAIGAVQAGVVASQRMPEFWKGTDNAPEGWAWTQERGREVILDKSGNLKSMGSDKGPQATYLNAGDRVLSNPKTMDFLDFATDLNNILSNNNIGMPVPEVKAGAMTEEQVNRIVDSIDNAEGVQIISDGVDIIMKLKRRNELIEKVNRRVEFKSKFV